LAGLGTKYNAPHIYKGRIEYLASGVFAKSLASGRRINIQLDHNADTVIASTANGLELEEAGDLGLLFRLDLRRAKNGSILSRMVETGGRACASVAYQVVSERNVVYAGRDVRVIEDADLLEISLCRKGAITRAFSFITNDALNPTIRGMERTSMFAVSSAAHRIQYSLGRTQEAMSNLSGRVDRLCHEAGIGSSGMSDAAAATCTTIDRVVAGLQTLRV
jgi:HK97 family phage prohead protease